MGKFNLNEFDGEQAVDQPAKAAKTKAAGAPAKAKMPMMNIRFSPENYQFMRREAALRGVSVIYFTNWIIDQYRAVPGNEHKNDLYQAEEKW